VLLLLSPFALGALALGAVFYYFGSDPNLPSLSGILTTIRLRSRAWLDRDGNLMGEIGSEHRTVVTYAQLPKVLIQAVLAAEDADFFEHEGLDYKGMGGAFIENLLRREFAQGARPSHSRWSSRCCFLPRRPCGARCRRSSWRADSRRSFPRREILALYFNQMYFGHGRYGVAEASRFYFGKSVGDLDVAEAALLAGMLQSPSRLSPYRHAEAAKKRQSYVLGQMAKLEYIYEERRASWPSSLSP